jgi:hypothetical protein
VPGPRRPASGRPPAREVPQKLYIRITKIGVVPMTSRFDLIKIFVIVAILGGALYYLAHYGLSLPQQ